MRIPRIGVGPSFRRGNGTTPIPPPPYAVFSQDGITTYSLITGLDYAEGSGPSAESALFDLYWKNLSPIAGNITITPSNGNVEIFNPSNSIWYSVAFNIGYLAATSSLAGFKVRMKAGLSDASYSTTFTVTAPNTAPFVLTCSGVIANLYYIIATGGTITQDGNYKVHEVLSTDVFDVTQVGSSPYNEVEVLLVAGGAGGGSGRYDGFGAGAGGAGGVKPISNHIVSVQSYPILIGAGSPGSNSAASASNGSDSSFDSIVSIGGGKGGNSVNGIQNGGDGGSGGGATVGGAIIGIAGLGTIGQGYDGDTTSVNAPYRGGGGGGAASAGSFGETSGNGGDAYLSSISGTPAYYGGGGGGGQYYNTPGEIGGVGGSGVGGNGGDIGTGGVGLNAVINTGSGGGGAGYHYIAPGTFLAGGNGSSGVVYIKYYSPA